jgi:hypothetical protein
LVQTAAVVIDPNGLKVRLLEGEGYALNLQKTHGRLGYLSVPVSDLSLIESAIAFYEETFAKPVSFSSHMAKEARWERSAKKGTSYRLVDMERFVEDLTTFTWLGNGPRHEYPCLCLFHKISKRQLAGDASNYGGSIGKDDEPLFLGVSFRVTDLDTTIAHLRKTEAIAAARLELQHIPGLPSPPPPLLHRCFRVRALHRVLRPDLPVR